MRDGPLLHGKQPPTAVKPESTFKSSRPNLSKRDQDTLEGLSRDGFQSLRARKRAHALLLLAKGVPPESVPFRTGLSRKSINAMLERLKTHGVHGAIFDRPHTHNSPLDNHALLADKARKLLASRPPPGSVRWGLEALTEAVRQQLPEGATLNRETMRQVLKKNLGIKSIRFVEPYWLMQVRKRA